VGRWIERRLGATVGGVDVTGSADDATEQALASLAPAQPVPAGVFRTCVDAFVRSRPLALLYRDAHGVETERRAQVHGILLRPPVWYLLAHDMRKGEPRTFRLDRVSTATPMLGHFEPLDPRELFEDLEGRTFDLSG
jgi:predicted DNA-binding transcriptional regulator YafY